MNHPLMPYALSFLGDILLWWQWLLLLVLIGLIVLWVVIRKNQQ